MLNDPFIFVMNCYWQDKKNSPISGVDMELRVSCRPMTTITTKSLKDIYNHPEEYVLVRIDPEKEKKSKWMKEEEE